MSFVSSILGIKEDEPIFFADKEVWGAIFSKLEEQNNIKKKEYENIGNLGEYVLRAEKVLKQEAPNFERAANLALRMSPVEIGFFLKREVAASILLRRAPQNLLSFLNLANMEAVFARFPVDEVYSALRFVETQEWMHETFRVAYDKLTPSDFEERPIELRVLGREWGSIAEQFVAKKHHNVSHLKELGVIFLNPIAEDEPGKFIRDFALLLHYLHEVKFYADNFLHIAKNPGTFAQCLASLLRGDVSNCSTYREGVWPIVQRYLFKENPADPRLFLPRVNPESIHWRLGQRDLISYGLEKKLYDLSFFTDSDYMGAERDDGSFLSFEFEDCVMSTVESLQEGASKTLVYHQREAAWTKICEERVGGEENLRKLLLEHFLEGRIILP